MNALASKTVSVGARLKTSPAGSTTWQAMLALQKVVNQSSLEPELMELVKLRASQINRCAFCLDLHTRTAMKNGERPERLYLLNAWEEVDIYTPREAAALRWTEALTRVSEAAISEAEFKAVSAHFTEPEMLELSLAIVTINGWNRLNVGFRMPPGGI